ncbi:transcriptional regulator [Herbaspirillum frisingense GSF30]|uniref:Transcriptional regulator n=1 Tax=Herbaspirillum frisingense GSF30 TaxID=864073 RepID=A0AAI9IDS8_9BURK|nr:transcriptional regulator [Herbaspirillum frisingense GSF30]
MKTPAISEEELHAYADGQLPASRAGEIAAWLEQDPAHAAELQQVRAWRAQNRALHAHYDPVLEEALPPAWLLRCWQAAKNIAAVIRAQPPMPLMPPIARSGGATPPCCC